MKVKFRIFQSTTESWPNLFEQAAAFASKFPRDRLISISHSCDKHQGVVTVWYWDDEIGPGGIPLA